MESLIAPSTNSDQPSSPINKKLPLPPCQSIPSFFPANKSPSGPGGSASASIKTTRRLSRSIWSIFRPSKSQFQSSDSIGTLPEFSYSIPSIFPANKSEPDSSFGDQNNTHSPSIQSYFPAYNSISQISEESPSTYEFPLANTTNTPPPTPPRLPPPPPPPPTSPPNNFVNSQSSDESFFPFEYSANIAAAPTIPMQWYILAPRPESESCAIGSTHQSSTRRNKKTETELICLDLPSFVQKALDSTTKSFAESTSIQFPEFKPAFVQSKPSVQQQQQLQTLMEGAHENWTYAILWESMYDYSGSLILGWANGYYKDKYNITTATAVEQKLRQEALNNLDSMICGSDVYTLGNDIFLSQDVPDTEWFFILSMFYSFVKGGGLPSHAFFHSSPIWVAGAERLAGLPCDRTRWGQSLGLQTMVCIPWANGVVELGSTELIFHGLHELDLIKQVRDLFKFSSTKTSSWPITEQGESKTNNVVRSVRTTTTNNLQNSKDVSNISNILARSVKRVL